MLSDNKSTLLKKILIFGNSGSGKSTLAKSLCDSEEVSHLDLDSLAWNNTTPPERRPLNESNAEIKRFIESNNGWIIEGCYSDLLQLAVPFANEIVFLNLPIQSCILNAKNRDWEPHKYESKEAQDANLEMLINWISDYEKRTDNFSKHSHQSIYNSFAGSKTMYTSNDRAT